MRFIGTQNKDSLELEIYVDVQHNLFYLDHHLVCLIIHIRFFISYSSIYVATRPLYAYKSGSYTHVYIPADTYFDNAHLDGMQWVYDGRDYREIASRIVWGVFTLSEANYTVYKENPPVNVFLKKLLQKKKLHGIGFVQLNTGIKQ